MIQLHGHELSGNSYKVRLFLELLNLDYEWIKVNLMKGEHKSPDYLALNPFGQVPLLVDGDTQLADAQAILVYLAQPISILNALSKKQTISWLSLISISVPIPG